MPDYKRLVSYMYNYEDGVKRNNVGYARVEARNGQCKFTLHITAPSLNEKQLKAYVFKRKADGMEGVLLGTFPVRNGVGDFKTITDSLHIMNSTYGLEDMGGIVLYLTERKYFATEWDDIPVTMSMVAGMAEKKQDTEERSMKAANVSAVLEAPPRGKARPVQEEKKEMAEGSLEKEGAVEKGSSGNSPVTDSQPKEKQSENTSSQTPADNKGGKEDEELKELLNPNLEHLLDKQSDEPVLEKLAPVDTRKETMETPSSHSSKVDSIDNYKIKKETQNQRRNPQSFAREESRNQQRNPQSSVNNEARNQQRSPQGSANEEARNQQKSSQGSASEEARNQQRNSQGSASEEARNRQEDSQSPVSEEVKSYIEEGKHQKEAELPAEDIKTEGEAKAAEPEEEGKTASKPFFEDHSLAKQIYRSFPRMYPFEDNEIAWCVRIEPKDIGLLPMESWGLGNNSFLLHGYYSYRHLIFARINDKNGMNYILGVPGIYHNREKFMAKMFGFENFKCAKRKAQRTGEFGYWYVPVILN